MSKEITMEELARMVNKGFEGVDKKFQEVDRRFDEMQEHVDKKFIDVTERLDRIEDRLDNTAYSFDVKSLAQRVGILEKLVGRLNHKMR